MRAFGLDVHRDFCEVAIAERGEVRSAGRVAARVESLALFAQSLVAGDVVALEATTGADRIVSLLQAEGIRVVVANTRKLRSITQGEGEDRPAGRAQAGAVARGGAARRGVDAGRADAGAATADQPARASRPRPYPGQE
jgi:transposase